MSQINLTIDGKELEVAPGTTILEAARQLGIDIPTFCYDPELAPNGACRICLVEVEKARALVASCVAPCGPGMVVYTESERVIKARRSVLSLLVANHPLVCITCEKTGNCKLQDYCYRYDVADSEYVGEVKELMTDGSNDFFIRDMNKCILCGICVAKCQDVVGAGAIDFTSRGFVTNVGPAFGDAIEDSSCVFCGLCIDSCPVGALIPKESIGKGRPWQVEKVKGVCPYCSIGCSINLHVKDNDLIGVTPVKESPVNRGHLCVRGKFGWDYLESKARLTAPLVKSNGVFVEVSWEEALGLIVDNIEETVSRYGPTALMGLCSPKVSNEESYLFQKLIRSLGSNNVDSYTRHCHARAVDGLMEAFGSAAMTNSIEELADTSAIFIIGADPSESHPIISYRIREAVRKGAELIIAYPQDHGLVEAADHYLRLKRGSGVALVNCFAQVIITEGLEDQAFIDKRTEGYAAFKAKVAEFTTAKTEALTGIPAEDLRKAALAYARADQAAIVSTAAISEQSGGKDLVLALANLAMLTGNLGKAGSGLYLPYGENNVQGATDMGVLPNLLPGYQQVTDKTARNRFSKAWGVEVPAEPGFSAADLFAAADQSQVKALYVLGESPLSCTGDPEQAAKLLSNLDFLVVEDIFMTETAALADVVLPATAFAEQLGTYTNTERRVQLSEPALEAPGDVYPDWFVLTELAGWLGFDWQYESPEDVFNELASLVPRYSGISYERIADQGIQWPCPNAEHPGSRFLYEGRFGRGLGLFSALDYQPPAYDQDGALLTFYEDESHYCHCQSERMSRHSIISRLRK